MSILIATDREVVVIAVDRGTSVSARGLGGRQTGLGAARSCREARDVAAASPRTGAVAVTSIVLDTAKG